MESKLQALQRTLEFRVDKFADGVHKLEQRVVTAGRQADSVLGLSQQRLKERGEKDRKAAGTDNLPVVEVLRSLGKMLPEGG